MKLHIDHSIITKRFKKFCRSDCKNLENQSWPGSPKTVDSKVVLQAIEVNLGSSIRRVSGELGISVEHNNIQQQ